MERFTNPWDFIHMFIFYRGYENIFGKWRPFQKKITLACDWTNILSFTFNTRKFDFFSLLAEQVATATSDKSYSVLFFTLFSLRKRFPVLIKVPTLITSLAEASCFCSPSILAVATAFYSLNEADWPGHILTVAKWFQLVAFQNWSGRIQTLNPSYPAALRG